MVFGNHINAGINVKTEKWGGGGGGGADVGHLRTTVVPTLGNLVFKKRGLNYCHIKGLAPVVQTMDSAIRRINHYPLGNSIAFASASPVDSDLSGG